MTGFPSALSYDTNHPNLLRRILSRLAMIDKGKTNNTGSITLTANSATTVVTEATERVGANTIMMFSPATANASIAISTTPGVYVSSRDVANNTFTITHANNAQTDRVFKYFLVG